MSLDFRKDLFADERDDNLNVVGKPIRRQDILGHVTGTSPFFDDNKFDNLLHLKCVRSPHHHARIVSIDTAKAEAMPGVVRLLRGRDVPVNLNTLLSLLDFGLDDEPVLAETKVSYWGEPIVAVIATSEQAALDAVAAVEVRYEELPAVFDVEEALKPGAPTVNETYPGNHFVFYENTDHQRLRFGDTEARFARAAHIVEGRYQLTPIEQAPMEPNGAIAAPETNDRFACYTPTQGLFFSVGTCAKVLDVDLNRLHFIGGTVGGGFGGKVDSVCEPLAILGAMLTRQPVRYVLNRAEEMQVSAPRSAELWEIKDGIAEDGRILAREFKGWFDAGAYTRLTSYGVVKCTGHLPGPYTIPAVKSDIWCVFTNRTPATAMRGFGVLGVDFAIERQMDKGARAAGLGPMEYRLINAYRDGDMKATRRVASNTALVECIQVAAEKAGYPLAPEYKAMTSMTGASLTQIPETVTDSGRRPAGYTAIEKTEVSPGLGEAAQVQPTPAAPVARARTGGASSLPERPSYAPQPAPPQAAPPPAPEPPEPAPAKPRYSRYSSSIRRR
ncbi:MAG: molybdopterin-dependent oxidoreductase [Paracoccaceae bacterium]|nr:molybdopterin-dependent oxidoreductase [Paracoccaceae bacterium]